MEKNKFIIEYSVIKKTFTNGSNLITALENISFKITQGVMVSIMGPSGSGKTTLLNLLAGLEQPDEGKIMFNGKEVTTMSEEEVSSLRCNDIGYIFQNFNLVGSSSVCENIEYPMIIAGKNNITRRKIVKSVLSMTEITEFEKSKLSKLSGGQMQRVAIARALVNSPVLILADEPTGNLDSESRDNILKLFRRLNEKEKMTIIIVTHDSEVAQQTDAIIHLKDGKIEKIIYPPKSSFNTDSNMVTVN